MYWKKLGFIYVANGQQSWAVSHAYVPTSLLVNKEKIRIYTAFLDQEKVGRIGFVDVDARNPLKILSISQKPVLDIGEPGTFDDHGVTPICALKHSNQIYLYYTGWQLGVKVRYFLLMGLAISENGGELFTRYRKVPILERSDQELFVRSAGCVSYQDQQWKMWYVASNQWINLQGKSVPTYNIRYIESVDGMNWGKQGKICIELAKEDEYGFGRPYVIRENGLYKIWYSIRTISKGYRLGYAESDDGLSWIRKDQEVGIDISEKGWDSQMICFSCIQKTQYGTYMFYNGNAYGQTGFGVAKLQD